MNSKLLARRLARVYKVLCPKPRDPRLPYVVVTDLETGEAWPSYEEHNREHEQLARRLGVSVSCYYGFDPNDEGCEP